MTSTRSPSAPGSREAPWWESAPDDEEIVRQVLAGERALFEVLMRRHNRRVFRAARAILKNDGEAEDVMQEAYVQAFAHLGAFGGRARFSTWLLRIAVHEALARLRRGRRTERLGGEGEEGEGAAMGRLESEEPGPEARALGGELRQVLEAAIDGLPTPFRVVFVLRVVEELSGAETAASLGIPEETVKTRLFRARALLRRALAERLESEATGAFDFGASRCDRLVTSVLARLGAAGSSRPEGKP